VRRLPRCDALLVRSTACSCLALVHAGNVCCSHQQECLPHQEDLRLHWWTCVLQAALMFQCRDADEWCACSCRRRSCW
jgi:hypothetical protein